MAEGIEIEQHQQSLEKWMPRWFATCQPECGSSLAPVQQRVYDSSINAARLNAVLQRRDFVGQEHDHAGEHHDGGERENTLPQGNGLVSLPEPDGVQQDEHGKQEECRKLGNHRQAQCERGDQKTRQTGTL